MPGRYSWFTQPHNGEGGGDSPGLPSPLPSSCCYYPVVHPNQLQGLALEKCDLQEIRTKSIRITDKISKTSACSAIRDKFTFSPVYPLFPIPLFHDLAEYIPLKFSVSDFFKSQSGSGANILRIHDPVRRLYNMYHFFFFFFMITRRTSLKINYKNKLIKKKKKITIKNLIRIRRIKMAQS